MCASKSIDIACEACARESALSFGDGLMDIGDALPPRWHRRIIEHRAYILCDICGHPKQFLGGLSPYLQDALGLHANASFDLPERADFF